MLIISVKQNVNVIVSRLNIPTTFVSRVNSVG